ncbi:MAG: GNAT family N-acetyltransferase [Gammaproteobacteria bacterium]|nr:GNAT family N-acetyltransferase [Gammaproteobacteria bacterium]
MIPGDAAAGFAVRLVRWDESCRALSAVRREVFVAEQGVPEALEIDGRDPQCLHAAAFSGDDVIGTGRLLPDGRIGRMAVLGPGVGAASAPPCSPPSVEAARRRGDTIVRLDAQVDAVGFYDRLGFVVEGDPFVEAGIVHQRMARRLDNDAGA